MSVANRETRKMETAGDVSGEGLVSQAYERVKPDLDALDLGELVQVNLDIPSAVATILGVLPEVKALRPRMERELPAFNLVAFDKLEDYALALSYAQTIYLTATQPPDDLQPVVDEGLKLRERLLAELTTLSLHGLVSAAQFDQLKGVNGYKNLAQDLQILSKLMEEAWPHVQGKVLTTMDDLQTAYRLSARLMRVVGLREQGPVQLAAATEARMRAFTIVVRTYEEARRAVTYLRAREGDADSMTPSLYTGRGRRPKTDPEPPPAPAPTPGTVIPNSASPAVSAAVHGSAPGGGVSAPASAPRPATQGPFVS